LKFGAIDAPILWQLLLGGLPGVLLGCAFARRVTARKLKVIIALIALFAGLQLVWDGTHTLWANHTERADKTASKETVRIASGGTTLNGASQIANGGTNAGSNLQAVRNLYTVSDQLSYTHCRHSLSFGGWLQEIQANDSLVQDHGQASFTNLQSSHSPPSLLSLVLMLTSLHRSPTQHFISHNKHDSIARATRTSFKC
jgi:hypothetical protein